MGVRGVGANRRRDRGMSPRHRDRSCIWQSIQRYRRYLIAKGELDEAIQWLEKAKTAPRYDPRHYPFMNLGRIYAAKGMVKRAIDEFEGALAFAPGDPTCLSALAQLRALLN